MSEFDSKALASAREVMALVRQPHIGGDVQLLAKIQCLFIEAMEYAAPQSFGNSEQLNSPAVPDGWIKCSEQMPPEATMVLGRCDNDYDFVNFLGGKLKIFCMGEWRVLPGAEITHWQPLPAAPKQESE